MPMAMLRFSGATARPTAPSTTEKVVPERPSPINTPAESVMPSAESESPMHTRPSV